MGTTIEIIISPENIDFERVKEVYDYLVSDDGGYNEMFAPTRGDSSFGVLFRGDYEDAIEEIVEPLLAGGEDVVVHMDYFDGDGHIEDWFGGQAATKLRLESEISNIKYSYSRFLEFLEDADEETKVWAKAELEKVLKNG